MTEVKTDDPTLGRELPLLIALADYGGRGVMHRLEFDAVKYVPPDQPIPSTPHNAFNRAWDGLIEKGFLDLDRNAGVARLTSRGAEWLGRHDYEVSDAPETGQLF